MADERTNMRDTILAAKILSAIELMVCSALLLLNLAGMYQKLSHSGFSRLFQTPIRQSFIALLMFCLVGTLAVILYVTATFHDWNGLEDECYTLYSALVGVFVTSKQFLYLFLYFRAKIVHDALRLEGYKMRWLRVSILFTITVGIPAGFGWTYGLVFFGKVIPEGPCVLFAETEASIISFAVCDVILSSILLVLFVVPIYEHSKQIGIKRDKKLLRVIRRNLLVGCLVMCSTSTGLIAMTVLLNIAHGRHVPPDQEYLQILATLLPCLELSLSIVSAHMLTRAWLPWALRRRLMRGAKGLGGHGVEDLYRTPSKLGSANAPWVLSMASLAAPPKVEDDQPPSSRIREDAETTDNN